MLTLKQVKMTTNSKEREHSKTGASSCKRWVSCPASVQLHRKAGDAPPSIYAAEGTRAHAVAEYALRYDISVRKAGDMRGWLGRIEKVDGFDIAVTQEMIDGAKLYRDTITEDMYFDDLTHNIDGIELPNQQHLMIETEINLGKYVSKECFGTVDAAYVCGDTVTVYDYKYGKGVSVDAKENDQMMYYAVGIIAKTGRPIRSFKKVILKIIQPRCPLGKPIKEWTTSGVWLDQNFIGKLQDALKLVESDNPPYQTGDEWCRWCPGKLICPEIRKTTHDLAKADFCDLIPTEKANAMLDVTRMSNIELSALLSNEKLIKQFLETGKEEAERRLKAGEEIQGFVMAPKLGNRVWTGDAEKTLKEAFGDDIYEPRKMLTPAKIEPLIKKNGGVDIDKITTRPSSMALTTADKKFNKTVEAFDDLLDDL